MSLSCDLYRLYYCTIAIIIIIINFISDQHLLKHYIQFFWVLVNTFSLSSLSPQKKRELNAQLHAFPMSGIDQKVLGNFTRNYGSFVGRDYKAWMQVSIA